VICGFFLLAKPSRGTKRISKERVSNTSSRIHHNIRRWEKPYGTQTSASDIHHAEFKKGHSQTNESSGKGEKQEKTGKSLNHHLASSKNDPVLVGPPSSKTLSVIFFKHLEEIGKGVGREANSVLNASHRRRRLRPGGRSLSLG